ncbi:MULTISPECIES: Bax inhibitor-1 family protein [unclassified Enterococcus]|uniref:Bax inhibitor-1 family protein n=1 Tax=unclassified Enterococcus TaxID=2608891 RepID=UPI003D2E403E
MPVIGKLSKEMGVEMAFSQQRNSRQIDRLSGRINSAAKIRYGYLTMIAAVLSFGLCLLATDYLVHTNSLYVQWLFTFTAALHGFIRTCLLVFLGIVPMWCCRSTAYTKPIISLFFFLLSLVVLGFPMGLIFLYFPNQMIVPAILETIGVTFLFCSIGLLTKKDLTNWGGFLSLALASLAMDSVLNLQFFHLSWFAYSISFGTTVLFLAYLIYDANQAMQNYDEAKRLGGIYFIAILLASSLEILLDMIYLFWNNLVPGDDNDADSGFDSFW